MLAIISCCSIKIEGKTFKMLELVLIWSKVFLCPKPSSLILNQRTRVWPKNLKHLQVDHILFMHRYVIDSRVLLPTASGTAVYYTCSFCQFVELSDQTVLSRYGERYKARVCIAGY